MTAVPVVAEELIIAETFTAGSSGHQLRVRVHNLSETQMLEGVSLGIVERPDFVEITAIRPSVAALQPREVATFAIEFAIAESAPDGGQGRLAVQVTAASSVEFNVTRPTLIVTARQPDDAELARERIAACDFGGATAILIRLPEDDPRRQAVQAELDQALLAHDRAAIAVRLAEQSIVAGDAEAAMAALDEAGQSSCPDIQAQVATLTSRLAEVQQAAEREQIATAQAALEACDPAVLPGARDALAALPSPGPEALALLVRIDAEIAADAAFASAEVFYYAGDLARTVALLEQARASTCPARQEAVAERLGKVERLREVLGRAEALLGSCDLGAMREAVTTLEGRTHVLLLRAKSRLDAAIGPLSAALAANEASAPAYHAGQLDVSRANLENARNLLDGIGPDACTPLRQTVAERLEKIDRLQAALARGEQARQACDVPTMEALIARAQGSSHVLVVAMAATLSEALPGCREESQVADAVPEPADDEPDAVCRARHGAQAYAVIGVGDFTCACEPDGGPCEPQTASRSDDGDNVDEPAANLPAENAAPGPGPASPDFDGNWQGEGVFVLRANGESLSIPLFLRFSVAQGLASGQLSTPEMDQVIPLEGFVDRETLRMKGHLSMDGVTIRALPRGGLSGENAIKGMLALHLPELVCVGEQIGAAIGSAVADAIPLGPSSDEPEESQMGCPIVAYQIPWTGWR